MQFHTSTSAQIKLQMRLAPLPVRRWRLWAPAMATLLLIPAMAAADPIVLPAASDFLKVDGSPFQPPPSNSLPGAVSFSDFSGSGICQFFVQCSFSISASATTGPIVTSAASSANNLFLGISEAELTYSYEVAGPISEPVPVIMTYLLQGVATPLSISGQIPDLTPGWNVAASIIASDIGPEYSDELDSRNDGCSEEVGDTPVIAPPCTSNGFNLLRQVHLMVDSNTVYSIELGVNLDGVSSSSVSATADPFIQIDPTFAGASQFSLFVSPGIGNSPLLAIPEPNEAVTVAFAFACVLWVVKSRVSS